MKISTSRPWPLPAQEDSLLGADSLTQPGTHQRELLRSEPIITKHLSIDKVSIHQDCRRHPLAWPSSILSRRSSSTGWRQETQLQPLTWMKSLQMAYLITTLLANIAFPNIRVNLRNLEDINCPPFYQLCPTPQPWSIIQKALWLASWLAGSESGQKIGLTVINRPWRTFFLTGFCCCTINNQLSFL